MPKLALTAKAIAALPIPREGRVGYSDTILPGLVFRVSSSGTKSYRVSWWQEGARPRITLGISEVASTLA